MSELYKITYGNVTGLCRAAGTDDAIQYMERRIGLDSLPVSVEPATAEDEGWFKAMGGGYIYETPAARKEDKEDGN